jgi:flagellar biosynthesis protein FliQ
MSPDYAIEVGKQAIWVFLLVAAPVLLTALVVGLVVSVFQAATSINEATLSFIPKLVAMFITLVVAGPWMIDVLTDYINRLFQSIPQIVG